MHHYSHYSVEDFVQDSRFRAWVRNPTAEEDNIWQTWIAQNAHKREAIEEARAIVLAIHPVHKETMSNREIEEEIEGILAGVGESESLEVRSPRRKRYAGIAKAASVSILLVAGLYGTTYFQGQDRTEVSESLVMTRRYTIERVNKSEEPLLINLPDNSSVLLSQNSLVRFPSEFTGDTRSIFLKGTAFFEVTKDPEKPFYVNAGKIVAKVLGTSFEISTDAADQRVQVIVKSGTVSIYSNLEGDGRDFEEDRPHVVLSAHEKFVLKDDLTRIQHTRLDPVSIEKSKLPDTYLRFDRTPVSDVFESLSEAYGVRINYEDDQISNCSVTASFTDEPFALKLDLICRSIGLSYEIINDEVTIIGKACKD